MSLVTSKEIFKKAYHGGYAIGAFNVDNLETFQAVVDAAKIAKSPVIIAITENVRKYFHPVYLKNMVKSATSETDVPIVLHLDHGQTVACCKEVIDDGFTSVMIDGSAYDFETNIAMTKEVVEYAHARGVVVEGELGCIAGMEEDIVVEDKYGQFTHPDDAVEFVKRTGIDSLAIAIGTAHGAFKYRPDQKPVLRFDILEEISKKLPNFPLVLHGASSVPQDKIDIINKFGGQMANAKGIPEEILTKAAGMTICKINVGSDLRIVFTGAIRKYFTEVPEEFMIRKYLVPARNEVTDFVVDKMTRVFKSANQA